MGNQMNILGKMSRDIQTFWLRRKWPGLRCIANYCVNGKSLIAAGFLFFKGTNKMNSFRFATVKLFAGNELAVPPPPPRRHAFQATKYQCKTSSRCAYAHTRVYCVCVCVLDRCIKRPRSKQLDSSQLLATSLVERDAVFECWHTAQDKRGQSLFSFRIP